MNDSHTATAWAGVITVASLFALALAGCGGDSGTGPVVNPPPPPPPPATRPTLDPTYRASGHMASGDVFVHLFEWKWTDVAAECETVLGPFGYDAVQVSPPQEHIVLGTHPWWVRYQPVSYSIDQSRSGTRAEFEQMVSRCNAAGVDVYVDAVINHMTAGAGTGSNGTAYGKYDYPGLYGQLDFHSACAVDNYQDEADVQDCELLGLADLDTGASGVQAKIADYLVGLVDMGVAGFRIDAAKHIQPVELDEIIDRVNVGANAAGRARPFIFGEVIDYGNEAVRARDYYGLGYGSGGASDITEFIYKGVGDKFAGLGSQRPADLETFSAASWGLMPEDKAVVFIDNHDTQRDGGLTYRADAAYRLANVWMLAQPYGYPKVMSSYGFSARDQGPPSDGSGATQDVSCAPSIEDAATGDWVCEHRDPTIAAMVEFRSVTAGADVTGWWDDGAWAVAFSRGDRGFVALSLAESPVTVDVVTPVTPGTYCDLITGGLVGGACAGRSVTVEADGRAQVELATGEAVAIHTGTRL